MVWDLSASAGVSTAKDNTVNTTHITAFQAAMITWLNTNVPATGVARGGGVLGGGAAYAANAGMSNNMIDILIQYAHNGTSAQTKYEGIRITLNGGGTTTGEKLNLQIFTTWAKTQNVTPRMLLRHYATRVLRVAQTRNIEFRVGKKAGIDSRYAYCGFDCATYATGLNTHERAAADAVFAIAISRAQGGATRVNNAVELTKGTIVPESRRLMF